MKHKHDLLGILFFLLSLTSCSAWQARVEPSASTPSPNATSNAHATTATQLQAWIAGTATALRLTSPPGATTATPTPANSPNDTATPLSPTDPAMPPVSSPAPTPAAVATAVPSSLPVVILKFGADRTEINTGDSVTFTWATRGANHVMLVRTASGDPSARSWDTLPLTGSLTVEMDGGERDQYQFELLADNGGLAFDGFAMATIVVRFPCPDTYFFAVPENPQGTVGDVCPAGPATFSPAAEQGFEGGRMIWVQSLAQIYVVYCRSQPECVNYQVFDDPWREGDLESDPGIVPPAGRYQPVRGLGEVWREQPGVRDRLGWAMAPEQSFTTAYQRDWLTCSGGCSHAGYLFLQASDSILVLDDRYGLWRYFP